MWLRFGVKEDAVYEHFKAIGADSGLDIVVHVYPASTKVSYSTRLMVRLAGLPQVKGLTADSRPRSPAAAPPRAPRPLLDDAPAAGAGLPQPTGL